MVSKNISSLLLLFISIFIFSCASVSMEKRQQATAHFKLGVSYLNDNQIQPAFLEFQKALEQNPFDKDTIYAIGLVYYMLEDFQKAKEYYLRAIDIDPNFSDAYNNLGVVYSRLKLWNEAFDSFKKALSNPLYGTPENAFFNLGRAYYSTGQFDKAIEAYNDALKRSPFFYQAYYALALSYNSRGMYGDASKAILKALELDPLYKKDVNKASEDFRKKLLAAKENEKKDLSDFLEILKY